MKIPSVFGDMFFSRQRIKVAWCVIERIPVLVVDHLARRDGAVFTFPNNHRAQSPRIRVSNFHESAGHTVFIRSDRHRANGHSLVGTLPLFELGLRRKANAFKAPVPRRMARMESVFRWLPRSPFIADFVVIRHCTNGHMPFAAALLTAKAGLVRTIRLHLIGAAAYLASFCNHARIIACVGAGSTGIADFFVSRPAPAKQEGLL